MMIRIVETQYVASPRWSYALGFSWRHGEHGGVDVCSSCEKICICRRGLWIRIVEAQYVASLMHCISTAGENDRRGDLHEEMFFHMVAYAKNGRLKKPPILFLR